MQNNHDENTPDKNGGIKYYTILQPTVVEIPRASLIALIKTFRRAR
jgi:hypothetical protein